MGSGSGRDRWLFLPLPSRERAGVRVETFDLRTAQYRDPAPHPALSPEYRGEGSINRRLPRNFSAATIPSSGHKRLGDLVMLTYSNPVYDGYFADPFVLKTQGVYYAY